ncbi:MAG: SPFH domain-containing protein [Desulfococcaceae bacterium]
MKTGKRAEMEKFVESQRLQLGLDEDESQDLLQQALSESEEHEPDLEIDLDSDGGMEETNFATVRGQNNLQTAAGPGQKKNKAMGKRSNIMTDPYLSESQTIKTRPTKVSSFRSLFFEHALPNEYIVQIGVRDAKPVLGGKYFKIGKRFLKFPAAVQTVYFTSDNANKNYQGLRIDGYACWRIDPEKPEIAVRSLDFTDRNHPMGNTNRILRTICTEAIRHIIANISIEDALTKKDEIGLNLKSQLERVERSWGILFDQVGIERVTILSSSVFEDLQQKTRDGLRLAAAQSRMETDQSIQKQKAEHTEEMEALNCETDKKTRILRAKTESETHRVELEERVKRETEDRSAQEQLKKAENEAAERSSVQKAEQDKRQFIRVTELESLKNEEKHKLETAKAASEAQSRINAAETEAKIAEVQARTELDKTEANHKKELRQRELSAILEILCLEKETEVKEKRLAAELKAQSANFEQKLREIREQATVNQEMETLRLERLKTEEEIKNRISPTRVMAGLVDRLPEIASSLHVDRYTVFSGNGEAPLSHLFAQILDLMGEHGISRFLKEEE